MATMVLITSAADTGASSTGPAVIGAGVVDGGRASTVGCTAGWCGAAGGVALTDVTAVTAGSPRGAAK